MNGIVKDPSLLDRARRAIRNHRRNLVVTSFKIEEKRLNCGDTRYILKDNSTGLSYEMTVGRMKRLPNKNKYGELYQR